VPQVNRHQVTLPLLRASGRVVLQGATGIEYSRHAQKAADVRTILQASPTAWGDVPAPGEEPRLDGGDLRPPVSAAVAVSTEVGSNDGRDARSPGELRLMVVGDSDFARNAMTRENPANLDFLVEGIRWITREPPRARIEPWTIGD